MIYDVITTKRFDKEVKLCVKRGYDMKNLRTIGFSSTRRLIR